MDLINIYKPYPTSQMEEYKEFQFKQSYPELKDKYGFDFKNLTANKHKINFVVTHGHCSDGFMSSTVVRRWMIENGIDIDTVVFYNAYHGTDFSKLHEQMIGKYVLICDFSFPKWIFDKMIDATGGNILVLDHHKTARKNLAEVDEKYLTFDMDHSGAFITWTFMYGFENVPKAVLYVEDNDIWNKALPLTREFTSFMFMQSFEFDEYEKFFDDQYLESTVFSLGTGMIMKDDYYIEQLAKKTVPRFMELNGRYYFVACMNSAGLLRSELGNYVLTHLKNANFSMIYAVNAYRGGTSVSYRSLNEKTDVSEIARLSGGGGHRNAAGTGFPHAVTNPPGRLIDQYRAYWLLDALYVTETECGKFVTLNSANMQTHLARYLIQERYFGDEAEYKNKRRTETDLPGYQEAMFCMRNRTDNQDLDEWYTGSAVWGYDGYTKGYKMTVKGLSETVEQIKRNVESWNQDLVEGEEDKRLIDVKDIRSDTLILGFSGIDFSPETFLEMVSVRGPGSREG